MISVCACAIDCEVQGEVPASPAQLLRGLPRGAYTALRAEGPEFKIVQVVGLHEHLQRLKDSLSWILQSEISTVGQHARYKLLLEETADHERMLWGTVSPTVRVAAKMAKQQNSQCIHWMVVLHLAMGNTRSGLLRAAVYVKPLAPSMAGPVDVAILGPPRAGLPARAMPAAKDSQWASDRMAHESHLPEGTTEGILCNPENALLEGLITNVFVVTVAQGEAMLQTAHPSQGILDGVMRRLIIQACRGTGMNCLEDAPRWDQRHAWVQAFTCNSVAGVRMITSMVPAWDAAAATLSFNTSPCPIVQTIITALAELCDLRAVSLLSDNL